MQYQSLILGQTSHRDHRRWILSSLAINLAFWLKSVAILLHRKRDAVGRELPLPEHATSNNNWSYRAADDVPDGQAAPEVRWQPRQIDPGRLEAHLKLLDVGLRPSSAK